MQGELHICEVLITNIIKRPLHVMHCCADQGDEPKPAAAIATLQDSISHAMNYLSWHSWYAPNHERCPPRLAYYKANDGKKEPSLHPSGHSLTMRTTHQRVPYVMHCMPDWG